MVILEPDTIISSYSKSLPEIIQDKLNKLVGEKITQNVITSVQANIKQALRYLSGVPYYGVIISKSERKFGHYVATVYSNYYADYAIEFLKQQIVDHHGEALHCEALQKEIDYFRTC